MQPEPTGAKEALRQGWQMVCVLPTEPLDPPDILEQIICCADQTAFLPFTYKGKTLIEPQQALWVKLVWSKRLRNLLLITFALGNPILDRFIREVVGENMPGLILTKDPGSKKHAQELAALLDQIDPEGKYH